MDITICKMIILTHKKKIRSKYQILVTTLKFRHFEGLDNLINTLFLLVPNCALYLSDQ